MGRYKRSDKGKSPSCCRNIRNYFREYCDNSSIHGFQYFGERRRTICEKLFWFITFTICLTVCIVMILRMYDKWQKAPVIVSFATKETPIFQIPFPAVTICPESKSDQTRLNYTKLIRKYHSKETLTQLEKKQLEYMSVVCNYNSTLHDPLKRFIFNSSDLFQTLDAVSPDLDSMISECKWMGDEFNCSEIFTPLITDEGICYTFNMLDRNELFREDIIHYANYLNINTSSHGWSLEEGYDKTESLDTYPRRALLAGAKNALSMILLSPKRDIDYTCTSGLQGYKVILHIPQRVPRVRQQYFRVPLDQSVVAGIQPSMMKTSDDVKRYEAHKRECYFPAERYLRYYQYYTQMNCQLECLTNYTKDSCGCVNFFMPRTNDVPICGPGKISCMMKAEKEMQMDSLQQQLRREITREDNNETVEVVLDCDCLPICTDLSYHSETSQTNWDWLKQYSASGGDTTNLTIEEYHKSSLTIFFKYGQFITSERNELYGPTAFLANFGGLLGLFTGFSILSIAELLYFLTLRILCNIKLFGCSNWAGSTDSDDEDE